jgi:uncharacterized protein
MEFIERTLKKSIIRNFLPNKIVVLLGARRTGKTFLVQKIMEELQEPYLFLNGDDITTFDLLQNRSSEHYKTILGNNRILIVDEAQQIPEIGRSLKLMVDTILGLKILVTGSSALDIQNKLGEPLTGRKTSLYLFPFSQSELSQYENIIETRSRLNERLIYGSYPELTHILQRDQKQQYLRELVSSYLLKDIIAFDGIRNSEKILNLLRLIAFQMGKEVSLPELGRQLGMHKNTVDSYLDLLSKTFVIFNVGAFSRNLRNEISKSKRWYFYDNGIRNALIGNFNEINLRNDQGQLWENYIISERIKYQNNNHMIVTNFFWRTYAQQEIDWIEEREGKIFAYEIKWNENKRVAVPAAWESGYPDSSFEVITPSNYLSWIL